MHFSAKRGIETACGLSVPPSVCNTYRNLGNELHGHLAQHLRSS